MKNQLKEFSYTICSLKLTKGDPKTEVDNVSCLSPMASFANYDNKVAKNWQSLHTWIDSRKFWYFFKWDYNHSMLFVKTETLTGSLKSYFWFYVDDTKLDIVNYGEETSFLLLVCWVSPQSISSEIAWWEDLFRWLKLPLLSMIYDKTLHS